MNSGFGTGNGKWDMDDAKKSYEACSLAEGKLPGEEGDAGDSIKPDKAKGPTQGIGSGGGGDRKAGCATVVIGFVFCLAGIALTVIMG